MMRWHEDYDCDREPKYRVLYRLDSPLPYASFNEMESYLLPGSATITLRFLPIEDYLEADLNFLAMHQVHPVPAHLYQGLYMRRKMCSCGCHQMFLHVWQERHYITIISPGHPPEILASHDLDLDQHWKFSNLHQVRSHLKIPLHVWHTVYQNRYYVEKHINYQHIYKKRNVMSAPCT